MCQALGYEDGKHIDLILEEETKIWIDKGYAEPAVRVVQNENWFLLSVCSKSFFFLSQCCLI